MDTFRRDGLTFDVRESGPADGPAVVCLHGFPQDGTAFDGVVDHLALDVGRATGRARAGGVAALVRDEDPHAGPDEQRDDRVERGAVLREAVQAHDDRAVRGAVVTDVEGQAAASVLVHAHMVHRRQPPDSTSARWKRTGTSSWA